MLAAGLFAALSVVVLILSWRLRDSPVAPRSCCSARPWPPDDLTGEGPEHR